MKKSFLKIFLILTLGLLCALALFSCGDEEEPCAHIWDEGKVITKSTCKKEGEVLFTCTLCSETKTEKGLGDHTYENDICTLCGAFNDQIKNPNLILIDSIFSENGVSFTGKNIVLTFNDLIDLSFTSCGANVKVTDSFLVGEVWAHGTSHGKDFNAKIEFKDKQILFFGDKLTALLKTEEASALSSAEELPDEKPYATYSQTELLQMLPLNLYSALFEKKDTAQGLVSIWDSLIAADNNIIEKKLNSLMNMLFIKSQTVDEYRYTINPTIVKSLLEAAKTKNASEFVNILLGKNFYEDAISLSTEVLDRTVSQIELFTKTQLLSYGISTETVISIIESIAGIDIDKELDEIKDYKIYELINEFGENNMTLDEYQKIIMEFDESFTSNSLFSLFISPALETYLTISYDEIADVIMYLTDASSLQLTVSPSYSLIQAEDSFNGVTISEEINGKQIDVSFSGSFLFKVNK